jgi:hypothetical protein
MRPRAPPTPDQKLAALPGLAVRRVILREHILASPREAAREIDALLRAARNGRPDARQATLALASALVHLHRDGRAGVLAALWEAAVLEGLPAVAALLDEEPEHRTLPRRARPHEVCFGERGMLRFWPMAHDGLLHCHWELRLRILGVDRLLDHPSPILMGRLLDERWLPLDKVLIIASRRPTSGAVAMEIACHDRWLGRIEVREALVDNPFTPPAVALPLLPTVSAGVLRRHRDTGAPLGRAAGAVLDAQ